MKTFLKILFITIIFWIISDLLITKYYGIRGFSKFYEKNYNVGHVNKKNFQGYFGGPIDPYYSLIRIGKFGERISAGANDCNIDTNTIFLGDSTTAGFEVDENKTFISIINKNCNYKIKGMNFGTRAYDTHQVIANYQRISNQIDHKNVVYLITPNDLDENMVENYYPSIIKKFGRIYNDKFITINSNKFEILYQNFRIFIGDNFYLTTKIINIYENIKFDSSKLNQKKNTDHKLKLLVLKDLIMKLNNLVELNNAKLYIAVYPCLNNECQDIIDIENFLLSISGLKVISIVNNINNNYDLNEKKKLKFRNDEHLSEYGHNIISQIIGDELK